MSKSAFAMLLDEARDALQKQFRERSGISFDWDGTDGAESWACWAPNDGHVYRGRSGEEALRRFVEACREDPC